MTTIRKLKLKKFTIKVYKKKQSNFINLFKKNLVNLISLQKFDKKCYFFIFINYYTCYIKIFIDI